MLEMKSVGDICQLINGYAFKPSDWSTEGTPIVRIQNLNNESAEFNYFKGKLDKKYYIDSGTLLFSWSGTPGTSFGAFLWDRGYAVINQHIFRVIPSNEVNIGYLKFALNGKLCDIIAKSHGGVGLQHITKKELEKITLPIPSINIQQDIVQKFNAVERLLEKRKLQLSKLDQLVKARFVEMFGDVENNIFNFQIGSIGNSCSLKSGTSLPSDIENEGGTIPYVKVADMNFPGNERYITTSSRYVTAQTAGKGIFPAGSVVFPKRGGAIGTNKKRLTQRPICADLNVMGVIPGIGINPYYLLSYFDTVDLGSLDNGSSVPQVNNKDIAPLKLLLPPLSLQEEFATFVQKVDKTKTVVNQSLEKLETLKKSLMQEYFG